MNLTPRELAELSDLIWVRQVNRVDGRIEILRPVTPTQHENFNVSPLRVENSTGTGSPARKIVVTPDSAVTFPGDNIIELAAGGGGGQYGFASAEQVTASGTFSAQWAVTTAKSFATVYFQVPDGFDGTFNVLLNGVAQGSAVTVSGANGSAAKAFSAVVGGVLSISVATVNTAGYLNVQVV